MNSRFLLYGKEFIIWAKTYKAKNVAKVSAREKTASTPPDILLRTVPAGKSTLTRSRKPATGLLMRSTKISTTFITPPPK